MSFQLRIANFLAAIALALCFIWSAIDALLSDSGGGYLHVGLLLTAGMVLGGCIAVLGLAPHLLRGDPPPQPARR